MMGETTPYGLVALRRDLGDLLARLEEHEEVVLSWPVEVTRNRTIVKCRWRIGRKYRRGEPFSAPSWLILLYAFAFKPLTGGRFYVPRFEHARLKPWAYRIVERRNA